MDRDPVKGLTLEQAYLVFSEGYEKAMVTHQYAVAAEILREWCSYNLKNGLPIPPKRR